MKKLILISFMAVFAVFAGRAEGISGKWKTSMEGSQGSMEMTFTFKVDGEKLTGTASTPMGEVEISNGKVNGNEFSFDIEMMGNAMPHKGKLEGEVIKLKVEMPGGGPDGQGGPDGSGGEMTLTRVK